MAGKLAPRRQSSQVNAGASVRYQVAKIADSGAHGLAVPG
jgi:hypothetical protein